MNRTTVELDDKTLQTLKAICAKERKSLKKVFLEVVRKGLDEKKKSTESKNLPLKGWLTVGGPLPAGIDPSDRSTYFDLLFRRPP